MVAITTAHPPISITRRRTTSHHQLLTTHHPPVPLIEIFDIIVLGLGGMGTAAAAALARRGHRVVGIEQFQIGHDRGSSHGSTRIIRKAYYEHPDYVPLLCRAYERWYELEQSMGRRLFVECGVLSMGPPTAELVMGVLQSAAQHSLPVELLTYVELRKRYPQFVVDEQTVGVLERGAGFLPVEECVLAYAGLARRHGATLHEHEEILGWRADGRHVEVVTDKNRYAAERLVVTVGAWATRLLQDVGVPFSIMRQTPGWFGTSRPDLFRRDRFPCYMLDSADGAFYGFPMIDSSGVKLAQHYGAAELADPSAVDWTPAPADAAPLRRFLDRHLPAVDGPCLHTGVCMYTLTPDRHFVIDLHPRHANVAVAAGFSGHGFKFASVVGEILADLAEQGRTKLPIQMFRATRFGEK